MNAYRRNVLVILKDLLAAIGPQPRALDFGAGDGWFAAELVSAGAIASVSPVDVQRRKRVFMPSTVYDGRRLPFGDEEFDLSYAIDVLHHCPDPRAALVDVLRCTRRHFIVKDHTYSSLLGYVVLCALDEIGNRRFGVPSLYKYQREWEWFPLLVERGFALNRLVYPATCQRGPLGVTNRLQFVAHFTRECAGPGRGA